MTRSEREELWRAIDELDERLAQVREREAGRAGGRVQDRERDLAIADVVSRLRVAGTYVRYARRAVAAIREDAG